MNGKTKPTVPAKKLVDAKAFYALVRAAQDTIQSVNGTNPELTRLAHDRALAELAAALRNLHSPTTPETGQPAPQ